MSSGDIDDRLAPQEALDKALEDPRVKAYIDQAPSLSIIRCSVPYTGGIAKSGERRYISDLLQTDLNGIDIISAPAMHESVEWAVRKWLQIGMDYAMDPEGHRLANRAEYNEVARLFPGLTPDEAWEQYDDFMDPQVRKIERAEIGPVAKDLALYPYEGTKLYDQVREARGKLPKELVNYRMAVPDDGGERCGTCSMYLAGGCTFVKGGIDTADICDAWEAKS